MADSYTQALAGGKGQKARFENVQTEFTSVETGFTTLEAEVDQTIRFTGAGMAGPNTLSANAANRASTLVAFDASGDPSLVATNSLTSITDLDGAELILDADGDTSITADTDDQIDFKLGGADIFKMTATAMTSTVQPAFLARAAGTQENKTGNGAEYTIDFDATVFNQGSGFDGTSTFTAPVTGRYLLCASVGISGLTSAADTAQIKIKTSNRNYQHQINDTNNLPARLTMALGPPADMDAGDTASVTTTVTGEASDLVTDIVSGSNLHTFFGAVLLT